MSGWGVFLIWRRISRYFPRTAGLTDWMRDIHMFNIASTMSFGPSGSSINAMTTAVPKLVSGLTRGLFMGDLERHWHSLRPTTCRRRYCGKGDCHEVAGSKTQVRRYHETGYLFPVPRLFARGGRVLSRGCRADLRADRRAGRGGGRHRFVSCEAISAVSLGRRDGAGEGDPGCGGRPDRPGHPGVPHDDVVEGARIPQSRALAPGRHLFRPGAVRACHGLGGAQSQQHADRLRADRAGLPPCGADAACGSS